MSEAQLNFPELICEDCMTDDSIKCKRNRDAKCLECGKELCGFHISKHLEKEHYISTTWEGGK